MSDSKPRDLTPEELASTQSPAIPQGTVPTLPPLEETTASVSFPSPKIPQTQEPGDV